MRLAQLKFEMTNQDSAGGKNYTVLTSAYPNRKTKNFSLETALRIHEKGFAMPKTILRASNLAPKMAHSQFVACHQVGK